MGQVHHRSCTLCEARCGIAVEVDGARVVAIRGDAQDPFSRGYLCPKGVALADLHDDPDRLRSPMLRDGSAWREVSWDEALTHTTARLRAIRAAHGPDAIGVYQGNPTAHNVGLLTFGQAFLRSLGTRNLFSSVSLDSLPHLFAAQQMFGDQLLLPVPDIDRTDLIICLGANPLASNGSMMTAPNVRARLNAISARGGQVIVLDPRRTETAVRADAHHFIRPGTDAVLLLAMIGEVCARGWARMGHVPSRGQEVLAAAARAWPLERAARVTGIPAEVIADLTARLAHTPRAVLYGRLGVCVQAHGGVAAWLCLALNALTGHLDQEGGLMFSTPAVDPVGMARRLGLRSGFARWRSRVGGLPEFGGELPMAAFVDELTTPGPGQVRALITSAGNPALSAPGGPRIDAALAGLEFMVSVDPYLNETTRHAHVILPPTSPLERAHYDAALNAFAVRNVAKYSPPLWPRAADARHDWEIMAELWARMRLPRGHAVATWAARRLGPEALLEVALRTGPWGLRRGRAGLSMAALRRAPHGLDLGPLEPRLPGRLAHPDRRVDLAPTACVADLARLEALDEGGLRATLRLIGRRDLRSNNSWMHNSPRLAKGPVRCTLWIHPDDAAARGLADGELAELSTPLGRVQLPVEVTLDIMRGVVSAPHGWGHDRKGTRMRVAAQRPGVSVNDILDPTAIDALTGTSVLTGQAVTVVRAAVATGAAVATVAKPADRS